MCWELGSCVSLISSTPDISLSPLSRIMDHEILVLQGHLRTQPGDLGHKDLMAAKNPGILQVCTTRKIYPMLRVEGKEQGLALESRWKTQRIWEFPALDASVFSGRFKDNFWRGFSNNSSSPSAHKGIYGKEIQGWDVHLNVQPRPEGGMLDPKGTGSCLS